MVFSQEWDRVYRENRQMAVWPWSDMVSYVMRYARPEGRSFRVLELGCGAGANIPFFKDLGVDYCGIEGSDFMVRNLADTHADLKDRIVCCDFTVEIPFEGRFDLVVDRSSLTHNTTERIKDCLNLLHKRLKKGGKFIGIDWFSTKHTDYPKGKKVHGDAYSRTGFKDGQFAKVGIVHFSDKKHMMDLFSKFKLVMLEHKITKREIPQDNHMFAAWNLVAEKR